MTAPQQLIELPALKPQVPEPPGPKTALMARRPFFKATAAERWQSVVASM